MDDTPLRRFFAEPACPAQRQYEALRAVFLDEQPQKEVAQRFGYTFAAFRQLVHEFRVACAAGSPPPFSRPAAGAGHRPARPTPHGRPSRRSPTSAP
jgi:hypothetical protein